MNAAEFKRLGYALVDWVADYRETLEARPVMSRVKPGDIRARLPAAAPEHGGGAGAILELLSRDVLPGITHWNHPSFFAYFPSNTSYASILADLACAGLGAQGMSWQTSPAATEIEEVVMDWLRQLLGLPTAFTGVIQDTASTATLGALICARERAGGLGGTPLCVYASAQAHSSVDKAAKLAGFDGNYKRSIATTAAFAMDVDALRAEIERDVDEGRRPCVVVATAGTTATTAFDPIAPIAELAHRHGMWLHVDAAMAGTGMVLPELRPLWDGVDRADSIVLNPHKWMGAGFDLSAYYCRDPKQLIDVMSTDPSYLRTQQDGAVTNFRDWHVQLGRRFRALKLWWFLLDVGAEGLRARLRRDLDNARWLAAAVAADPAWTVVAPVALQTVCIRHASADNLAIARRVNDSGVAYVTPSVVEGQQIIRVSIGAERTERRHVEAVWAALRDATVSLDTTSK
jgi:aromatic-L-amino-acid decarboxylase